MAPHPSYPRTRLYVTEPLVTGAQVALGDKQAHYLLQVLRHKPGDPVALFNGRDGEWQGALQSAGKKNAVLAVEKLLRPQAQASDLWLLCAPLKGGKTEWVVEKATELGVARICPVLTRFTVADRINDTRLGAIAVEAAEQCERLDVPAIDALVPLETLLGRWDAARRLIYGDESGMGGSNARDMLPGMGMSSMAVLIGPEGGFSASELELLRSLPYVSGMCLGPRVLRADTAAIAALTLVQAFCGDWDGKPAFRTP
jgi:16S rRNA (uracil1498-N3)-methyltransferase